MRTRNIFKFKSLLLTVLALSFFTACPKISGKVAGVGTANSGKVVDEDFGIPDTSDNSKIDKSQISEARLTEIVTELTSDKMEGRNEGTAGSALARKYLIDGLKSCGVLPANGESFEQKITTGVGTNILGKIVGTDAQLSERIIFLSAHYDHLGVREGNTYHGALDNAAGVSEILGIACALAKSKPKKTVQIAFWDAEEPSTFLTEAMGSQFYVANPLVDLQKIDVSIVLDLVGAGLWKGYANQVAFGSETSKAVADVFAIVAQPTGLKVYQGGMDLFEETVQGHHPMSDYDAFRNQKIPILFFSDGTNVHYHRITDIVANLDLPKMSLEAEFLMNLTVALASDSAVSSFRENTNLTSLDYLLIENILKDALGVKGLIESLGLTDVTKNKLSSDLVAVQALKTKIDAGTELSVDERQVLRTSLQRVQCLANKSYPANVCLSF